jgi:hypothetical protein
VIVILSACDACTTLSLGVLHQGMRGSIGHRLFYGLVESSSLQKFAVAVGLQILARNRSRCFTAPTGTVTSAARLASYRCASTVDSRRVSASRSMAPAKVHARSSTSSRSGGYR